ncbi:hypothetical protein [Mesohalobacter halotolerans]|uniref:Uncharacterized protein n=1 Tax=Mesohalobacter halotolerans TaxID=1883405 RepID=A0A4U5TRD8_9FLAO|nr:hypothetical protein [Mesohalobacter halotolerans]MBS3737761.1 hypothetical protein [Psychroflexus sp.]TKS56542.1 hypothetical protein FCN74_05765 [Mesohalobacter halotolerans]
MEHKKAQQKIEDIISDVENKNAVSQSLIEQLKDLRTYAVEAKQPVVAKALRLASEHIEENESFIIPIPTDEPLEGEEDDVQLITGVESFVYFMNLIKNSKNKINLEELREYNRLMDL